ncbi:MAG: hypothetical protein RLZZ252_713 [Bacteroidota bacterium]
MQIMKKSIQADKLTTKFPNGKIGLHPCTFSIEANTMVAILGPSGCGKTTLLKTLAGVIPNSSGKIIIAGKELGANYELLKTHIGYVPQHDHHAIHYDLTVKECLTFSARLRLPDLTQAQQDAKVDSLIRKLNIEKQKNNLIRNLSGGQQKRVSIAVELLIDPIVLFLDEPTSPLDPQTISEFLKILKGLTLNGTTVVMVTHKPEDLSYMDECFVMGVGGYLVYKGPPKNVVTNFSKENILDVYQLLDSNYVSHYAQKYFLENQELENAGNWNDVKLSSERNVNYLSQFLYLSYRNLVRKINARISSLITILQAPIIATLMILIFEDIDQIVLFFIAISAIWFGTNNAAKEIVEELPYEKYNTSIYVRERMYNLGIIPYILSKVMILSLLGAIQSFLFIGILYLKYKNSAVPWENFTMAFLWMSFTILVASLLGLVLSAFSKDKEQVMSIIPIALIPQIMIAGVIVNISKLTIIAPASYLTISRWSTTGLARIQANMEKNPLFPSGKTIAPLRENMGSTYEYEFGFSAESVEFEYYVLLAHVLFYFILIYFKLRDRDLYRDNFNK